VALVQEDGELQEADYYCWQHKDQAEERVAGEDEANAGRRVKRRSTELYPLQERNSIDTLVQRLGIESVPEQGHKKDRRKTSAPRPPKRTETIDFASRPAKQAAHGEKYGLGQQQETGRPKSKKAGFWQSLCCMFQDDEGDYVEIVRHKKRVDQSRPRPEHHHVSAEQPPKIPSNRLSPSSAATARPRPSSMPVPARKPVGLDPSNRPMPGQRSSSNPQTSNLLSLLPPHLSPQTTSTLLAEFIKPISAADEEGYIYIFWLTPQSKSAPAEETARSLLSPPDARPHYHRRVSDVMTEFSFTGEEEASKGKQTIMLKIGRANNVTRRMNEWQRQCGYALNLVRWYPYIPSPGTPSPNPSPARDHGSSLYPDLSRPPASQRQSDVVRKVPYVKRVERLIHLELQEQRVKRECEACGKEHREWFEVEASQAGVKAVDDCVKRWVGWAERLADT
jgi:hypothetical protein